MSVTPILTAEHAEIPGTVAQVYSHLNSDEQQEMFERTIAATGSRQAAEERFQAYVRVLEAQGTATICVPKPPKGVALQSTQFGPYRLFYHPGPEHLRAWSFYFGPADQGSEAIIEDWRQEGISVSIETFPNRWDDTPFLLAAANARVRISYRDESQEKKIEEVVFPPASGRPHIPVRYLQ